MAPVPESQDEGVMMDAGWTSIEVPCNTKCDAIFKGNMASSCIVN